MSNPAWMGSPLPAVSLPLPPPPLFASRSPSPPLPFGAIPTHLVTNGGPSTCALGKAEALGKQEHRSHPPTPFPGAPTSRSLLACLRATTGLLNREGLYRVPGSHARLTALRETYNKGKRVDFVKPQMEDPFTVADLLTTFLRNLPEPIFTNKLLPEFERATGERTGLRGGVEGNREWCGLHRCAGGQHNPSWYHETHTRTHALACCCACLESTLFFVFAPRISHVRGA